MANANAQTHDIDLASPNLNLDKYKLGVSQFDGFNYRNSPFISHEIKNLYTKQVNGAFYSTVINDDIISIDDDGKLKRNSELLHTFKSKVQYDDITPAIKYLSSLGFTVADIRVGVGMLSRRYTLLCIKQNQISSYSYDSNSLDNLPQLVSNYELIDWHGRFRSDEVNIITAAFGANGYVYYVAQGLPASGSGIACYFVAATVSGYWDGLVSFRTDFDIVYQKNGNAAFLVRQSDSNHVDGFFYNYKEFGDAVDYSNMEIYTGSGSGAVGTGVQLSNYIPFEDGFVIRQTYNAMVSNRWICFSAIIEFNIVTQSLIAADAVALSEKSIIGVTLPILNADKLSASYDKFCPAVPFGKAPHNVIYTALYNNCVYATINKSVSLDGYCKEYMSDDGEQMLRLLYNNGTLQGISALRLNSDNTYNPSIKANRYSGNLLFEYGIISKLFYCDYQSAIIKTVDNKFIGIIVSSGYYDTDLQILFDRYVVAKTADYLNCYDLEEDKLTHIADDWNNRFYCSSATGTPIAKFIAASVGSQFQAMFTEKGIKQAFPGRQANSIKMLSVTYDLHHIEIPFVAIPDNTYLFGIDVYVVNSQETNTPYYYATYPLGLFAPAFPIGEKGGIVYVNTNGNLIEPIPILCQYKRTSLVPIVKMLKASAFLFPIGIDYFGLYYLLEIQENFKEIFSIQNQLFAIANDSIWSISYKDGIIITNKEVCICKGLRFLCSTPIAAFFWCDSNNTIYQFQGDNLFHRGQCIDEINEIIYVDFFEHTNDIVLLTDKYALVLSEQYAYKIEKTSLGTIPLNFTDCGFGSDYFWIKANAVEQYLNSRILFYSYKKKTGYKKQNIIIKTQLYGLGDNMLSETDCVYIRVFNAENEQKAQTVKVGGFTLTDKKTLLENNPATGNMKVFTINPSDWTDDGSYYIRYQPTFQKALGIQIEIESTVPITYIGVSNIPDTKMITKL